MPSRDAAAIPSPGREPLTPRRRWTPGLRSRGEAPRPIGNDAHPRTIGWFGTSALAMGGSNQSLFLIAALVAAQGSGAIPLLIVGLLLAWAALPGWTELILMWPKRVGGIAATCAEAFRPYSAVLANLTGVCYWWGWIPTCGLTAILSASALHTWYLPGIDPTLLAVGIVVAFALLAMAGVWWVARFAGLIAIGAAVLAFLSTTIPVFAGAVDWRQAVAFDLETPFDGSFGWITSAMAGLYLIGFAAPAFEAAACHVGETRDPTRNVPRAMFVSAGMASVYFIALPIVWLGVIGTGEIVKLDDLPTVLGPTFAPLVGGAAKAFAIWFMVLNMFHGTLQPLAGAARTLSQLSEDGLLPRALNRRTRRDVPWVATWITAAMAIAFLLTGNPVSLIAAANLTYLIGICLPSVAVWLLRRNEPERERPYRAPRGTIVLGVVAAWVWGASTLLGFQQYGLPSVIAGLGFAYAGAFFYAYRVWEDARLARRTPNVRSLHVKLTGAMLLVIGLDGAGYLLALNTLGEDQVVLRVVLEDIFVGVAVLTITVGLVLPGMISHTVSEIATAARRLAGGTIADLRRAMRALADGELDAARARVDAQPIEIRSRDEVGEMAESFNSMQGDIARTAVALDEAREGLRSAQSELKDKNAQLARWGEELERRVAERTAELTRARDELAALATTDPLTGLPNHRALVAALDQEIDRSNRFGRTCALLFVDVDHFKDLNDTFGHATGDEALRDLARVVRSSLRTSDTVGRWGGEEFLVLLPEADLATAVDAAERLRAAVAAHAFGDEHRLTCSIGVAVYPVDAGDRTGFVDAADRAMYAAKRLGRNLAFAAADPAVSAVWSETPPNRVQDSALAATVEALALLVEARDRYTAEHTAAVAALARRLAIAMACDPAEVRKVALAGRLHDVGKVAVPDAVLAKVGPLTNEEWRLMRQHPEVGAEVVARIPSLRPIAPIVRGHHERWDGSGYPDRLRGADTPLGARIVAVVDAYMAMTTDRPYRARVDHVAAVVEIERCAGTQFDPEVVAVFSQVMAGESDPVAVR